ncbi:hypothetical protein C8A01DRAFT_31460 [Parachaetomium inaequale]|uniref:DUF7726 domain-containing protein n=1 Tax=Parachaetomium inaequale TaxID=2588326 RepID=A0AAN6SW87_9PEZI|nr:hypothetical protein C8A01DRAFT_31460 [Parachaetomium inaequale]
MGSEYFRTALGALPSAINTQLGQTPAAGLTAARGQENVPVAMASAKPASKKRKSTEDHAPAEPVDLDDIDLEGAPLDANCDQVRRKITKFLDSGAMTKTAFAKEIGVSAKSLGGFLGVSGRYQGSGFAAYPAAWEFFKKREIAGVKLPTAKKQKTSSAGEASSTAKAVAIDISDVVLPGEEDDNVSVFDTCDEVRKKINAHLKKPGVTQAQFCRDIYAQLGPTRPAKPFQSSQLAQFRNAKGALSGAKSRIFYGAYVFFEKLRIKGGKPKTKHRLEMEEQWGPGGMRRDIDGRQR